MNEPTELLEHAKELFPEPESGAAEVRAVVARRHRNRRLAAALGVVAIWLVLLVAAAVILDHERDTNPAKPTPPPAAAAGTLAYINNGDAYVADPDGSNAVKIADGASPADCYGWSGEYWTEGKLWSPDGRYLAFLRFDCSDKNVSWDAVISDADGNVLATFPAQGWKPAWSPDSTRLAIWKDFPNTIGVYGLDGTLQTQLAAPGSAGGGDNDPVWMPDGTSLMIGDMEVPIDGSTPHHAQFPDGDYSRDGSHVSYFDNGALMVSRSDGSDAQEVFGAGAEGGNRAWSPTGDRIAFTSTGPGNSAELRVFDVATGSVTLVTEGEQGWELGVVGFSPNGERILYSRTKAEGNGQPASLWSIRVDGSDVQQVVAGTQYGDWLQPALNSQATPTQSQAVASRSQVAPPTSEPAPAQAGSLAYINNGDVYVADADGSNAVKIADGRPPRECSGTPEYWVAGSMWSPDGRYLAYRDECPPAGAAGENWVISDAEGHIVARLPGIGWHVGWSPDSTRIAVWDSIFETIGIYGLDGGRQTQLTVPPDVSVEGEHDPTWKPDGSALMVPNEVFPLDGSAPQRLWPGGAGWTTYSPDGSRVAYVNGDALVVARSDGSQPRAVTDEWTGRPAWSPAGDRIAFTTNGAAGNGDGYLAKLSVLDVATGSVTPLIDGERGAEIWIMGFSPQGDRILFGKDNDLWSIGVDGSHARLVVAGTDNGEWLSLSPQTGTNW